MIDRPTVFHLEDRISSRLSVHRDFIKSLGKEESERHSCILFHYHSQRNVIEDICAYFKDKLSIDLSNLLKYLKNNIRAKYTCFAGSEENGIIRIVKHTGPNLITPLVDAICSEGLANHRRRLIQMMMLSKLNAC